MKTFYFALFENLKWQKSRSKAETKQHPERGPAEPRNSLTVENLWQRFRINFELLVVCRFFSSSRALQTATRLGIWMEPSTRENLFKNRDIARILALGVANDQPVASLTLRSSSTYIGRQFETVTLLKWQIVLRNFYCRYDSKTFISGWSLLRNDVTGKHT